MGDIDPNTISNGTCYWAKGKKMHPSYIPCGNDLYGHKHCCWAGDSCLVENTCFGVHGGTGDGTYLTYLAGCSDPEYEDASCPDKNPFRDQPWAGLILCPDDVDTWVWLPCSEHGAPTTPARGDPCTCPDDRSTHPTVGFTVFSQGTRLSEEGKLPITAGGTINFNEGMEPTITTTLTLSGPVSSEPPSPSEPDDSSVEPVVSSSSAGSNSAASTASTTLLSSRSSDNPTPSALRQSGSTGGLSTGAKAGIGVGAGIVGLALLGVVIFLVIRARRSRDVEVSPTCPPLSPGGDPHQVYPVEAPEGSHGSNCVSPMTGVSEMESAAARPWSLRSELESTGPGASPPLRSELDTTGSPPLGVYDDDQHMQPQNFSPSQPVYGNSYGIQHSQQWTAPYPPDAYPGTAEASVPPETQPGTRRHGGSHYIHELG